MAGDVLALTLLYPNAQITFERFTQIMMAVHTKGKGVCGIFSKEIAEMMSYEVNNMAKHHNHPLLSEIEPLTD